MKKHLQESTPFWQAVKAQMSGEIRTPEVSMSTGKINYWQYQLAVHKFELGLHAKGIKPNRNWKVSTLKEYYGLTGKPEAMKAQLQEIIDLF